MKRFNEYAKCKSPEEICEIYTDNEKERKLHRELMEAICWESDKDLEDPACYTYVRNMKRFRTIPEAFFAWMFDGAMDAIEYWEWD